MEQAEKIILLVLLSLFGGMLPAQVNWDFKTWETGIHKNMLITNLTFTVGSSPSELKYYVYTSAEWTLTDHLGAEGSLFFNAGSSRNDAPSLLTYENVIDVGQADYAVHNLFLGPNYHFFDRKRGDVYVGVQPGLALFTAPAYSYERVGVTETQNIDEFKSFAPNVSFVLGTAYYGKLFHAFVQGRYVLGRFDALEYSGSLNEFRISIGLGFNLF